MDWTTNWKAIHIAVFCFRLDLYLGLAEVNVDAASYIFSRIIYTRAIT